MLDHNDMEQLVNFIYAQGNVSFDLVLVLGREVQNLAVYLGITENRFNRNTKNWTAVVLIAWSAAYWADRFI